MANPAAGRIQGDNLIHEVLRNMEEGLFHIRQKAIVPAVYRIYLNPSDFEPFRDIAPFVATEIREALDEQLRNWNSPRRRFTASILSRFGRTNEVPSGVEFVRVAENWIVELHPDLDGELQPGEIEVYSDLGAPQKSEYGGGSLTRRIRPEPEPAVELQSEPASEPESTPTGPSSLAPPVNSASSTELDGTKSRALAYIRYVDQRGPQEFEITKVETVIGRGGKTFWVDLKLETLTDVSREHCRIRRDQLSGRFTVEDLSQFGTSVDGKPVSKGSPSQLPAKAIITLAGVVDLSWEVV